MGPGLLLPRETAPKVWQWMLSEVKQLLADLPPEGSKRLYELREQIPRAFRLHWLAFWMYNQYKPVNSMVDWT